MKKVSLAVTNRDCRSSLEKLREIGVIHFEKKNISSDILTKLLDRKIRIEAALRVIDVCEKTVKETANTDGEPDIVKVILDYSDEQKRIKDSLSRLARERTRIEEWGNFDPRDIAYLTEKAKLNLFLYELPRRMFENLPEEIRYIKSGENKKNILIVVFDSEIPGKEPVKISEYSLKEIDSLIPDLHKKLDEIDGRLCALASGKARMVKELKTTLSDIEFETVRAGMNVLEDIPAETTIAWITGYIPREDLGLLKKGASENGWALAADDPAEQDYVPTKLKNNRLVMLLNPLTDFLDVLPGYREVDVSGWFLLFFTLFFGMIFGDAAYGALIIIISVTIILKTLKKGVHPGLKLLLLLGISNFLWGALTCSWLGLPVGQIPPVLQKISLPLISNVTASESAQGEAMVRQHMMILCFSLALLHLSIGHIIAISQKRDLKILADIGAIAMLIGMYGVVLFLIASNEYHKIPLFTPCVYILGAGFILNTVFINYEGSIAKSVTESLKNFISVILGISNVFSDIMSYLRLWAVGLAGSAISSIVVSLAGPMLGHLFFFLLGVILLVSGHGLNLVLSALSVLVHGVRLNTLEFSGRVGLNWSGYAYKPFSSRENPHGKGV